MDGSERDHVTTLAPADRMAAIFAGLERVYGLYVLDGTVREDGKLGGRGVFRRAPNWPQLWRQHLAGEQALGVVPLRDDATCYWGCIDIDAYQNFDLSALAAKIAELNLPLVLCRSKSGGAHLYLLAAEPVPARLMRARLTEIRIALGLPKSTELYPHKDELANAEDCGHYVNMPYFNEGQDGRYALRSDGSLFPLDEFLNHAETMQKPAVFFEKALNAEPRGSGVDDGDTDKKAGNPETPMPNAGWFADGPPCLQKVYQIDGIKAGNHSNDAMHNIGIFFKKRNPEGWEEELSEFNYKHCHPPLPRKDLEGMIRALRKTNYVYGCEKSPLVENCEKEPCRRRTYGIGPAGSLMPTLGQLVQFPGDPVVWEWTLDGTPVKFSTEELQSPRMFQKRCMEALRRMVPEFKKDNWAKIIGAALSKSTIADTSGGSTIEAKIQTYLRSFCTGQAQARSKKEVLRSKPWTNSKRTFTWFRIEDFEDFIMRRRFYIPSNVQLTHALNKLGAKSMNPTQLDKSIPKSTRLWKIPMFEGTEVSDYNEVQEADDDPDVDNTPAPEPANAF